MKNKIDLYISVSFKMVLGFAVSILIGCNIKRTPSIIHLLLIAPHGLIAESIHRHP